MDLLLPPRGPCETLSGGGQPRFKGRGGGVVLHRLSAQFTARVQRALHIPVLYRQRGGGGGRKDVDDRRRRPSSSPHADIANQFYIAPWSGALSLLTQRNNSTVSRSAASIPIGPNQTLTCENNFIFSIKKSS